MQTFFTPGQVVFVQVNDQNSRLSHRPAVIIRKCPYYSYRVSVIGNKLEEYISQHLIFPFTTELFEEISSQLTKQNKKLGKYMKSAQNLHEAYTKNKKLGIATQNPLNNLYKEEESDSDEE